MTAPSVSAREDSPMRLLNIHDVNDVRLGTYGRPDTGPKDVVVPMRACGICGGDLSYIKNGGIPGPVSRRRWAMKARWPDADQRNDHYERGRLSR